MLVYLLPSKSVTNFYLSSDLINIHLIHYVQARK